MHILLFSVELNMYYNKLFTQHSCSNVLALLCNIIIHQNWTTSFLFLHVIYWYILNQNNRIQNIMNTKHNTLYSWNKTMINNILNKCFQFPTFWQIKLFLNSKNYLSMDKQHFIIFMTVYVRLLQQETVGDRWCSPKVFFCHNISIYIQIKGNVLRGITLDKIIRWMV